jgi:hypothetical protein
MNEKRKGKGVRTWEDSGRYEGDWEDNYENGLGIMVFTDGTSYNGQRKGGLFHGDGVFKFADGTERRGIWKYHKNIRWLE